MPRLSMRRRVAEPIRPVRCGNIDSAIISRPSRFDRKYHFKLPSLDQRSEYLQFWQDRLAEETAWSVGDVEPVASLCEEFSFAYLKELVISSVMHWMQDNDVCFVDVLRDQAKMLQKQMKTEMSEPSPTNARPRRLAQRNA